LLAKDDDEQTAWLLAQLGYEEIFREVWVWDRKVQLTPEDDLLLVKDKDGQTARHGETWRVCKEILKHM